MDVERLPFDQYQRYRLVSDLIERVRDGRGTLRVLDVGGRTALLREFLTEDQVVLVDMEPSDARGLVLGDGSCLPFRSGVFDVVAAFDTLEHVPPDRRAAFVAECARVSRGHVFLANPYHAPRVEEAEVLLVEFLHSKLRVQHRYLDEHRSNGLPDRAATEAGLREAGMVVDSIGHGNLDRWLVLMCLEFYLDYDHTLRDFAQRVYKFYNASLYASDHAAPVYRHVVVGARPGLVMPTASEVLGAPGAPPEAMPALLPFAQELLSFDLQRGALEPEMARLHEVVRALNEDLRQHGILEADLRLDLDRHRITVADLTDALERERAGGEAVRRALEADLAGHRAVTEALRAELAQHQAVHRDLSREIEARGAALGEAQAAVRQAEAEHIELGRLKALLEADLVHHRRELEAHGHALADREARVDDLHSELAATLARARSAEDELDHLRQDVARMVGLLRDRRKNLLRAFSPRKFGDGAG